MKKMYLEFWGGVVDVKIQNHIPATGRYICTDFETGYDFYDIDEFYIIGVPC